MKKNLIFNAEGVDDIQKRTIIKGNTTWLFNLNDVKYTWAKPMYQTMVGNFWLPEKVSWLKDDQRDFTTTLSKDEQRAYKGILSFLIFLDSIQTVNLPNISQYITSPEVNLLLSIQAYQECLTEETEFLSQSWWKKLVNYVEWDLVLQYNLDWTTNFISPSKFISYDYNWEIHSFKWRYLNQSVTPNHRMVTIKDKPSDCGIYIKYASELKEWIQSYWFISTWDKKWINNKLSTFERFLIALQADWTIHREWINSKWELAYKNRNWKDWFIACIFSFSKQRKIDRMNMLIKELWFEYSILKIPSEWNIKERTQFRIKVPTSVWIISKDFSDWVDLECYNSLYYKEFIDEVWNWDASKRNEWNTYYYSTNKTNADYISSIASLAWYRVITSSKEDKRKSTYLKMYYVSITDEKKVCRWTINKEIIDYTWKVSCFTVDSWMFLIRSWWVVSVTWNCIHSQSYATILESVVSPEERDEIYYFWRENKILLKRNEFIGNIYQDFIDEPSDKSLFKTIVANFILESLYFYNWFAFFDTLVDWMKMPATGRMIAYIRRDELTHITLFANILREIKKEFPSMWNEELIKEMMRTAVNQEIEWANEILGSRIIWMNGDTTREYTEWLANQRLGMIGVPPIYKTWLKNPYLHLDRIQNSNGDKGNFFETTVTNYTQSTGMNGSWDF